MNVIQEMGIIQNSLKTDLTLLAVGGCFYKQGDP